MFPLQDHAGPEELCEVARYLGRADPWYESNINTLCHMIPKLATMVRGKPPHFPKTPAAPEEGSVPCRALHPQTEIFSCKASPGPCQDVPMSDTAPAHKSHLP